MSTSDDQFQQDMQGDPEQWQANQPFDQGDPNQWQASQPPDQDVSQRPSGGYGPAGQGQMGDALSRDVDPSLAQGADRWTQDPNQQQGNQQANQWGQDPTQQQGVPGQQGNQWGQDPSLQQGSLGQQGGQIGQDPYQTGMQGGMGQTQMPDDPGMMASGYGENQPDLAQTNPSGIQNQPDQQNITPAQGAPVQPNMPGGQPPVGDEGMLGSPQDDQRSSGGGLGDMLGRLFGRHHDEVPRGDPSNPNQ